MFILITQPQIMCNTIRKQVLKELMFVIKLGWNNIDREFMPEHLFNEAKVFNDVRQ